MHHHCLYNAMQRLHQLGLQPQKGVYVDGHKHNHSIGTRPLLRHSCLHHLQVIKSSDTTTQCGISQATDINLLWWEYLGVLSIQMKSISKHGLLDTSPLSSSCSQGLCWECPRRQQDEHAPWSEAAVHVNTVWEQKLVDDKGVPKVWTQYHFEDTTDDTQTVLSFHDDFKKKQLWCTSTFQRKFVSPQVLLWAQSHWVSLGTGKGIFMGPYKPGLWSIVHLALNSVSTHLMRKSFRRVQDNERFALKERSLGKCWRQQWKTNPKGGSSLSLDCQVS